MKTVLTSLLILSALTLGACNGQNPFKRQSNPIKDYPGLAADKPASTIPQPPPPEVQPTQSLCGKIFNLDIDGSRGKVLKFTAGKPSQVKIVARWYPLSDYTLQIENPPKGMTLVKPTDSSRDQNSVSVSTWTVSWNPSKSLVNQGAFDTIVTFRLISNDKNLTSTCGSDFSDDFTALVKSDVGQVNRPIVSIEGLPQSPVAFGDNFKFKIIVSEVESKTQPQLNFGINLDATTGEQAILSAEEAVGCAPKASKKGTSWIFSCDMSTDRLFDVKTNDIKKWIDSGSLTKARFDVIATVNGEKSEMTPAIVSVQFAQPITANADPIAPKPTVPPPVKTGDEPEIL